MSQTGAQMEDLYGPTREEVLEIAFQLALNHNDLDTLRALFSLGFIPAAMASNQRTWH